MYDRKEIKKKSKAAFKANYWKTVLVTFIYTFIAGGAVTTVSGSSFKQALNSGNAISSTGDPAAVINEAQNQIDSFLASDPQEAAIILAVILGVIGLAAAIATAIDLFVVEPFRIGACSFYDKNEKAPAEVGEICAGFKIGYMRNVLAVFLVGLFTSIGFCLLFIPGILFTYGFRLVPYILTENPEMTAMEALKESHRLMKGNRWHSFVLDLSFIGWDILSALTMGILAIFFTSPYKNQAKAGFYEAVKQIKDGSNPTVSVENVTA